MTNSVTPLPDINRGPELIPGKCYKIVEQHETTKITYEGIMGPKDSIGNNAANFQDGVAVYVKDQVGCKVYVERVPDPLPTTPTSIIWAKYGTPTRDTTGSLVLATNGKWHSVSGLAWVKTFEIDEWEIRYDAGANS